MMYLDTAAELRPLDLRLESPRTLLVQRMSANVQTFWKGYITSQTHESRVVDLKSNHLPHCIPDRDEFDEPHNTIFQKAKREA